MSILKFWVSMIPQYLMFTHKGYMNAKKFEVSIQINLTSKSLYKTAKLFVKGMFQ